MKEARKTLTAGGVVINHEGKVLVVSQHGTSWSLPKGHIDEGEANLEAAKREIYEESGVTELEYIKDLGVYERYRIGLEAEEDKSELKTIYMYLFKTNQMDLKPIDPENPEALWVDKEIVGDLLTHIKDKEFYLSVVDII
ncbi:MAG: NUDIX domain-containing protein [Candidatus Sericytochromatia bacterium]